MNCFASVWRKECVAHGALVPMETVTEYADRKTELERKIGSLETERNSLLGDIVTLKERISTLELEKAVNTLEGEVQALRTEKAVLEEKAAKFSEETFEVESQGSEGLQV